MDSNRLSAFVDENWERSILPSLSDFIKIPCLSPHFDADWESSGHIEAAVDHITRWCREQGPEGLELEVVRLPGRTPLIFMEVRGEGDGTVLLYGHLDKQPEMVGWDEDKGPWKPVLQDDKLYGRGGGDDGYAVYTSLLAIRALQEQGLSHPRCVILIEACEESGSYDLPHYIDALQERIGTPGLIVCIDSGAGNYEQWWCTSSLRGMAFGKLSVEILKQGVHSGDAGGIVPSSFRIARSLLSRLEDEATGAILPAAFSVEIPDQHRAFASACAEVLGAGVAGKYPFVDGAHATGEDPTELVLDRTWRSSLSVTGANGFPAVEKAGNVLRPITELALSLRLPPSVDAVAATDALTALLERDPPYGAKVRFEAQPPGQGWALPTLPDWLAASIDKGSRTFFERPPCFVGEGGSIPFMGLLSEKYPAAHFLVTGVLGPGSNAHGPNEFLHIPAAKRLTCGVATVLADFPR